MQEKEQASSARANGSNLHRWTFILLALIFLIFFAETLVNFEYNFLHLFRAFFYFLGLIALFLSLHFSFESVQKNRDVLASKNIALKQEKERSEKERQRLVRVEKEMEKLMSDLQNEKNHIEEEKALDLAIINGVADGIIVLDVDDNVMMLNDAAVGCCGIEKNKVLGVNWFDFTELLNDKSEVVPIHERPARLAIENRETVVANKYFLRKRGSEDTLAVAITASPIKMKDEVIGVVIVFRDVKKERDVDRMKTEFIALVSHQLSTPLTAMRWFTDMLLDGDGGELNAQQRDFVEDIKRSNIRMVELVQSLLKVSRLESGHLIIEPSPIDMKKVLNEIVFSFESRISEKDLKLTIEIEKNLPIVSLDKQMVEQVWTNLLSNAVKYTKKGSSISISIYTENEDIVCKVSDNGRGIPQDDQKNLFSKFFRGENIKESPSGGTGLGLYMVKLIMDASGGKIWFESKENSGTTFWFSFPLEGVDKKTGSMRLAG